MGNEQSATPAELKSRHSVDANFLRQVTPRSTPRVSVAGYPRLPAQQNSDGDSTPNLFHRLSTDCAELKYFKPKLSLSGEEMGNQQGRRLSRAANQMETTGDGGLSLIDSVKLTKWVNVIQVLFELLDSLINDLSQPGKIVQARCMDIGASHVNMNEKCCGNLWDTFGECLAEVVTKQDCIRPKRECSKAWISLISFLVDGMKCGYMDEWKRKQSGRLTHLHQPIENGVGSSSLNYGQCPHSSNGGFGESSGGQSSNGGYSSGSHSSHY